MMEKRNINKPEKSDGLMGSLLEVAVRTIAAFILFIFIAHLIGKQAISQMTYHDFIASITLGSIAGNLTFNTSIRFTNFLTAALIFSGIILLTTYLSLKSRKARAIFNGQPTVVIEHGKILEANLRKLKMTLDSLNQALREKEAFDINQVDFAIIEADGELSLLKKPPYQTITRKDLGILTPASSLFPVELVMDGQLIDKNLEQNHLTRNWLFQEIKQRGLNLADISYCVRGTDRRLYFDLIHDTIAEPVDSES
jgi:Predicted membrane protein